MFDMRKKDCGEKEISVGKYVQGVPKKEISIKTLILIYLSRESETKS